MKWLDRFEMVCTLVELLLDLTRIERQHRIVGTRCYTAYTQFWPCGSLKLNLVMSTSEHNRRESESGTSIGTERSEAKFGPC